eukprot:CAMPEP_0198733402 /NCGR_PEP_ID=MMETSP1475-20131203/45601_1 /TAXON_ID= ORGANISM="Unidentified sp., Strain CCMP1999" /NCGR_SAMPLE_ID=MMETSP1475 /ASSEMBLY_ACC=CAM_ASM_001111 /LENGTH=320 /DNA_ID=CAMNT_0044496693 /DNA_START=343 /DNA_END=1305 /DNA_ORIENTATION=-
MMSETGMSDMGGVTGVVSRRRAPPMNLGLVVVPQQSVYIVERFGRFHRTLNPGLQVLIPLVDRVTYVHSLKEEAISIPNQMAITRDNVTLSIDGVLYVKVVDAVAASYGVENPYRALTLLAQTTMRSELGKLSLDETFLERESLNARIVRGINEATTPWGMRCFRYEIRDISPPAGVRKAMELQAEAERRKRAQILDSEAEQKSEINVAEGQRTAKILVSEGRMIEKTNRAQGESEAILTKAKATAEGLGILAKSMDSKEGDEAVALRMAEQYIQAFAELAAKHNTVVMPMNVGNAKDMVQQSTTIFREMISSNTPQSKK